jgi:hypothetical protein
VKKARFWAASVGYSTATTVDAAPLGIDSVEIATIENRLPSVVGGEHYTLAARRHRKMDTWV